MVDSEFRGPIAVGSVNIAGWPFAASIGNGLVSATVSPEAARVVSYNFAGTNPLFVNVAERGKVYPPSASGEWHNFGGARFDVAPQSAWATTSWGKNWPPPPILNSPRHLAVVNEEMRLDIGREVENHLETGIKVLLGLVPDSTIVSVTQTITNIGRFGSQWSNWLVVQLAAEAGQSMIYVPGYRDSVYDGGYYMQMKGTGANPIACDLKKGAGTVPYDGTEWKFGFDKRRWIAFRPDRAKDAVFLLLARAFHAGLNYPDGDSSVEYYSAGHMPYVELELLGPLAGLCPKEARTDEFMWAMAACRGDIIDANERCMVTRRLTLEEGVLRGGFGVFYRGTVKVIGVDADSRPHLIAEVEADPFRPLDLNVPVSDPSRYSMILADLYIGNKLIGILDIYDANANNSLTTTGNSQ